MNTTTTTENGTNEVINNQHTDQDNDFVSRYKTQIVAGIIVIILGIFGYGFYSSYKEKSNKMMADELFAFTSVTLKDFNAGKVSAEKVVSGFQAVYNGKEGFSSAGAHIIELSDALLEKNKQVEAYNLLSLGLQTINNNQMSYFLNIRAAAVAENLNKPKQAIKHLEDILSGNLLYMSEKIYLDAGRLYLMTGDKEKAKSSFKWVMEKGKEAEFKKLARLYLEELGA